MFAGPAAIQEREIDSLLDRQLRTSRADDAASTNEQNLQGS
jgi:hypothetical protein